VRAEQQSGDGVDATVYCSCCGYPQHFVLGALPGGMQRVQIRVLPRNSFARGVETLLREGD
jgi:hypothetical protein